MIVVELFEGLTRLLGLGSKREPKPVEPTLEQRLQQAEAEMQAAGRELTRCSIAWRNSGWLAEGHANVMRAQDVWATKLHAYNVILREVQPVTRLQPAQAKAQGGVH